MFAHARITHAVTRDVRVHIYGPLEARLQSADLLMLGGLNEATWPPETRSDPWLSRPMRRDLGLDPPERRIGLSAHDFAQSLGAPEIVLTRAAKLANRRKTMRGNQSGAELQRAHVNGLRKAIVLDRTELRWDPCLLNLVVGRSVINPQRARVDANQR